LIATEEIWKKSYSSKANAASKYHIPVVGLSFLDAAIAATHLVDYVPFVLHPPSSSEHSSDPTHKSGEFHQLPNNWPNHPTLTQSLVGLSTIKVKKAAPPKRGAVVPPTIRAWPYKPSQALQGLPYWPEHEDDYEIAKMFLLVKGDNFFSIELHVIQQRPQQPQHPQQQTSTPRLYRVFTHEGGLRGLDDLGYEGQKECRYLDNLPEAEAIFTHFFDSRIALGYKYLFTPPQPSHANLFLCQSFLSSFFSRFVSFSAFFSCFF